jgi:hypothetical protein
MDMTKFEYEDDPGFEAVAGELRRWSKELARLKISDNTPGGDTSQSALPHTTYSKPC